MHALHATVNCPLYLLTDVEHSSCSGKSTFVFIRTGHNRKLRLLGVSTIAGNQTVEKVTVNALGVVDAAGLQSISKSAAPQSKQAQRQLRGLTLECNVQMCTRDSQSL